MMVTIWTQILFTEEIPSKHFCFENCCGLFFFFPTPAQLPEKHFSSVLGLLGFTKMQFFIFKCNIVFKK